jgi:hypothetical protein
LKSREALGARLGIERAVHGRRGDPGEHERDGHVLRVLHAGTEDEPLVAAGEEADHLATIAFGDVLLVDRALEGAGDVLPAAGGHARRVQAPDRRLRDQRAEIALLDQIAHRDVVRDLGEERILAAVQEPGVQSVRRRGESDEPDVRVLVRSALMTFR